MPYNPAEFTRKKWDDLSPETYIIGNTKVTMCLGDIQKPKDSQAIAIVDHLDPMFRSSAGSIYRSPYQKTLRSMAKTVKEGDYKVGDIAVNVMEGDDGIEEINFMKPNYMFTLFSVNASKEEQFNIVRRGTRNILNIAALLPTDELDNGEIKKISLIAFATGLQAHLMAEQSARSMLAGIDDFNNTSDIEVDIIIKDDRFNRPILPIFKQVAEEQTYKKVLYTGEIGKRETNVPLLLSAINLENGRNKTYDEGKEFERLFTFDL